jgi:hypothetical protein
MAMIQGKSDDFSFFPPFSRNTENDIRGGGGNTDTRPHELHAYVEEERRKGERDKRKKRKGAKERHYPVTRASLTGAQQLRRTKGETEIV